MNLSFDFSINLPMLITTFVGMPLLLYGLRIFALKAGLVDVPNARKIHAKPVPITGGLALFIMAIILMAMTNTISEFGFYLLIATGLVVIVGLLDDLYQLSETVK